MALRLVLVSAVAGLGFSLPSEGELNACVYRAQNWMNARLAEWDSPSATDRGSVVFVPETTETSDRQPSENGVRVGTEVVPGLSAILAEEIDAAFDAIQDQMVTDFGTEPTRAPAPTIAESKTDPKPKSFTDEEFEAVQEEMAASFAADLAPSLAPRTLVAEVKAPGYEPIEVDENYYTGEAYALNRAAEGLAAPAPETVSETPSTGEKWVQAIRLTREAVFAWANLLNGPAVVALGH